MCRPLCWRASERSPQSSPRLGASRHKYRHVGCPLNSGPLGYRIRVDDTSDVEEADQHCFGLRLGIGHKLFLTSAQSYSWRPLKCNTNIHVNPLFHPTLHLHVWTEVPQQCKCLPSPEDGNIQFPKRCVFQFLYFRTMGKIQSPSNCECYTLASESSILCLYQYSRHIV
jgi:hypothetical protein